MTTTKPGLRAVTSSDAGLLTVREAAEALRVSVRTVYRLIAGGELDITDVAPKGSKRSKTRVLAESLNARIDARTYRVPQRRARAA